MIMTKLYLTFSMHVDTSLLMSQRADVQTGYDKILLVMAFVIGHV